MHSSAQPKPQDEKAELAEFYNHAQNTHHAAVSSSVGYALFKLRQIYFPEVELKDAAMDAVYEDTITDIEKHATTEERKNALKHLIAVTKEPLNQFDMVKFSLQEYNQESQKQELKNLTQRNIASLRTPIKFCILTDKLKLSPLH